MVGCGVLLVEGFHAAGLGPLSPLGLPGIFLIVAGALWGSSAALGGALMLFGYFLFTLGAPQRFPHFYANPGVIPFWFLGLGVATSVAAVMRGRLMQAHALALKAAQNEAEMSALIDYRQWLNTIIDNAPALIGYIDAEQRFQFNNATYEHWLEKPKAEITGRTVREVFGEDEYRKIRPHLERALGGGRVTFHHELSLYGEVRHAQTSFVPEYDPSGRVRGCFVVAKDVGSIVAELRGTGAEAAGGIATQTLLTERLRRALARAQRSGAALALLQLDVGGLPPMDEASSAEIGARLRGCVRLADTVARLGAGRFVVLLEGLKERGDAFRVAEKMLQAVRQPIAVEGRELRPAASIGVAFPDEGETTPDKLVSRASAALSQAKAAGRGAYKVG